MWSKRMLGGWIGVDLDGTLAHYDGWKGDEHIGDPIPRMVWRVQGWISQGQEVRIFTARVSNGGRALPFIEEWCQRHIGHVLAVTNIKDMHCIQVWDDRAIHVETNTGEPCCGHGEGHGQAEHAGPGAASGGDVEGAEGRAGRGRSGPGDEGRSDARKAPGRRGSGAAWRGAKASEGTSNAGAGADQGGQADGTSGG